MGDEEKDLTGFRPTDLFAAAKEIEADYDGEIDPINWLELVVAELPEKVEGVIMPVLSSSQVTEHDGGALQAIYNLKKISGFDDHSIALAVIGMAGSYKSRIERAQSEGRLADELGSLATLEESNTGGLRWLIEKYPLLWIQLLVPEGESLFGVSRTTYDEVYQQGLYSFTRKAEVNAFAKNFATGSRDPDRFGPDGLKGKKILTIGGGLGADEEHFVKRGAHVCSVDSSTIARCAQADRTELSEKREKSRRKFANSIKDSGIFYLEEKVTDMSDFMSERAQKIALGVEKPFDAIYSHSVWHLNSYRDFMKNLRLAEKNLKPGGLLAISLRMPDVDGMKGVNYGRGIRLDNYTGVLRAQRLTLQGSTVELNSAANGPILNNTTFLSPDGVVRRYADSTVYIEALREVGLDLVDLQVKTMSNYGVEDSSQPVLYVTAKKRKI